MPSSNDMPNPVSAPSPLSISADLILDTIPDGLIVLDASCRIRRWNRAMTLLSGYPEATVLGQPCAILNFRDADNGCPLEHERECLIDGKPDPCRMKETECTLQASDGSVLPVRKYGRVLVNPDGQAAGILLVLTDMRAVRNLEAQLYDARHMEADAPPPGRLLGNAPAMQEVYRRIRLAAQSDVTVLITGETGTGKELAAEALHILSPRRDGPLVRVNCSALPESLLESELFGHVKGAFTGAVRDHAGRIEMAGGGTLFLDEIGDISPLIQLKLLRVLQEHTYERVGDTTPRTADVRFVTATNRDLKSAVAQGRFREDVYYRIHVFPIEMPPLRERPGDLDLLCERFIRERQTRTGKRIRELSPDARRRMLAFPWPGNVRQLENAIEHAFVTCAGERIEPEDLPDEVRSTSHSAVPPGAGNLGRGENITRNRSRPPITAEILREALAKSNGNQSEAARRLGVDRTTVWRQIKRWSL